MSTSPPQASPGVGTTASPGLVPSSSPAPANSSTPTNTNNNNGINENSISVTIPPPRASIDKTKSSPTSRQNLRVTFQTTRIESDDALSNNSDEHRQTFTSLVSTGSGASASAPFSGSASHYPGGSGSSSSAGSGHSSSAAGAVVDFVGRLSLDKRKISMENRRRNTALDADLKGAYLYSSKVCFSKKKNIEKREKNSKTEKSNNRNKQVL